VDFFTADCWCGFSFLHHFDMHALLKHPQCDTQSLFFILDDLMFYFWLCVVQVMMGLFSGENVVALPESQVPQVPYSCNISGLFSFLFLLFSIWSLVAIITSFFSSLIL
jgi:hypothetical protein